MKGSLWKAGLVVLLTACAGARCEMKPDIEYGPFISATILSQWPREWPRENGKDHPRGSFTYKGIAVHLGAREGPGEAGVLFDTDLMRVSAAWSGGFLRLQGIPYDMQHGINPEIAGAQRYGTRRGPGWTAKATFDDPRPIPYGPLPRDCAKYKGLYRNGNKIVFSYTVAGTDVLESHSFDNGIFFREFTVAPNAAAREVLLCESDGGKGAMYPETKSAAIDDGGTVTSVRLFDAGGGLEFNFPKAGAISLKVPAGDKPMNFKVALWSGPQSQISAFMLAAAPPPAVDLKTFCVGGPALWAGTAEIGAGKLGEPAKDFPYTVDTLPVKESPMMRTTGLDFFKDGRLAVCTLHGDVWIASGIDTGLKKVTWMRYASGLFQPLGLRIVDDVIYVLGRDQITKLVDVANTGEADFYANFNNDGEVSDNFHEFAMDLQTDAEGNFYYTKAGPVVPGGDGFDKVLAHHGCLLKVAKDGSTLECVASGLRATNGISIGLGGEMTSADNEGSWMPSTRINWMVPGGFYGCTPVSHRNPAPTSYDPPLCWIPHMIDNSAGGQVWINSGNRFGPLEGRLLHMSYGKCALFLVLAERIGTTWQGGVVKLPLIFRTGIMRGRFNPIDGQLYVCGVRGWQSDALKWGGVQRVRYTGGPFNVPISINAHSDGISLTYLSELDKDMGDADNFAVAQWNYKWSSAYGSKHYLPGTTKEGEDKVDVTDAKLSADRKTVKLLIPGLKPVNQMRINVKLKTAEGTKARQEIYNTINVLK